MAAVLNHSKAVGTDKVVLLGIANHAGDGGAWPTVATLARYANTTERTVQRSIGQLVKLGELAVERQAGGLAHLKHSERPNRYDVLVSCPQFCDGTVNHRLRSYPQPVQLPIPLPDLPDSDRVTQASPGDVGVTPPGDTGVTHNHPSNLATIASCDQVTTTRERAKPADPAVAAAAVRSIREQLGSRAAR